MKIKTIGYGELKTGYNYNNKRLYIEAELSKTDDPNKVYQELQRLVKKGLSDEENKSLVDINTALIEEDDLPF